MNSDKILWESKSNSLKGLMTLLPCAFFLIVSLIGTIVFSSSSNETIKIVWIALMIVSIIACLSVLVVMRMTALKWERPNLIFTVTENGIYFTSKGNDSFFYVEWAEISGYLVKPGKNGKATVTVKFNCVADAGVFGKITYMNMAGIKGAEELIKVFEAYGKKDLAYSKN